MRLGARTIARIAGVALGAALWCAPSLASAEPCSLLSRAKGSVDLIVYFTKFPAEDETGGKYKKCRLVSKPGPGTKTFRVTPFRRDANVVVHRSNWP